MIKRTVILSLAMFILNLSFGTIAFAQAKDDKAAQRERDVQIFVNRLGTNNRSNVKVSLKNDKKSVGGSITEINDDTFVVINKKKNTSTTIAYRDVKKISKDTSKFVIVTLVTVSAILGGIFICVAAGHCTE